ncbi:MAG: hypothetical protein J6X80_03545 [Lachnospiraceae bacterium]|nr:hypothetical protein [Lachnospiraceae bacterium]
MYPNDYIKAIDGIVPDENIKEEIRNNLFNPTLQKNIKTLKKTKTSQAWKIVVAAIAVVCTVSVSVPVIASGIRSLIINRTPSYAPLTDSIETSVYSQSDEHINMSVEEMLSDGMVVEMTVKYTALDDIGRQWLKDTKVDHNTLYLKPAMFEIPGHRTNFGWTTDELDVTAGEDERIFMVELSADSRDYFEKKGVLSFPMTESKEEVMLDISGNVEIQSFILESNEKASDYYTPTYIEISPMTFVIYAQNHGVYERITSGKNGEYTSETWLLPNEELDSLEKNTYFILKDGSKEYLYAGAHSATEAKEENHYSDVMLYSTRFMDFSDSIQGKPKLVNPDDFEAIVINGVRFDFVQ